MQKKMLSGPFSVKSRKGPCPIKDYKDYRGASNVWWAWVCGWFGYCKCLLWLLQVSTFGWFRLLQVSNSPFELFLVHDPDVIKQVGPEFEGQKALVPELAEGPFDSIPVDFQFLSGIHIQGVNQRLKVILLRSSMRYEKPIHAFCDIPAQALPEFEID